MHYHQGMNRRKFTLAFFTVLSASWGIYYGEVFFIVLSEVLIVLLFLSWLYLHWNLNFLEMERHLPPRAFEGEEVQVQLKGKYSSFLPLKWVYMEDQFGPDISSHKEFSLSLLTSGPLEFSYQGECVQGRGRYKIGPLVVVATDPLGLWQSKRQLTSEDTMVILPGLTSLASVSLAGSQNTFYGGSRTIHKAGISYDFLGTREYRYGDSLKYIHWPATAHAGKLIIKEFQMNTSSQTTVVIDLHEEALQGVKPNTLDYSIKVAGSLCRYASEKGQEFRLLAEGQKPYFFPMARGAGHLAWILEELALMKPLGTKALHQVLMEATPLLQPGEEVIVVAASHILNPDQFFNAFTIYQAKEISLTVVLLVSESFEKIREFRSSQYYMAHDKLPGLLAARGIKVVAIEKGSDLSRSFEEGI